LRQWLPLVRRTWFQSASKYRLANGGFGSLPVVECIKQPGAAYGRKRALKNRP
jgi:hypothetical protein